MAQRKKQVVVKDTTPKEEIKETTATNKPAEETHTLEKVKTELKELSPTDKWNAVTSQLIQKFPVFQPGELDLDKCTIEDRKVHIRGKLGMTDEQIKAIIPGY